MDAAPVKSIYQPDNTGTEPMDKSKLVYLTADSPNTINDLDPEDIYIIGGIVDRNRYLKLTFNKAEE